MKNKIIYVSGIVNLETIVNVDAFPIYYNPVEYPFFGINSTVSGSAYNIAKALKKLGNNDVFLSAHVGKDMVGDIVINEIEKNKIDTSYIKYSLDYTPNSVVFVDRDNNVKNYSDLKDVQEISQEITNEIGKIKRSDLIVLSNTNFNRPLLKKAKELGKKVATDVHIIGTIDDEFNKDFMKYSDILFLSKKGLSNINYEDFLLEIYNKYHNEIIVLGEGREGAMILSARDRVIYHIDAVTTRDIVNTVGSRDALLASFVHFYLRRSTALNALELAETFTSYKLGESGGANGFLDAPSVRKLAKTLDFDVYKIKEF